MRWTPFSTFTSLEREMQDLVDRFGSRTLVEGFEWKPSADVYEDDGRLVIRVEIPGIDPEKELAVEVKENVLHISGEKKREKVVKDGDHHLRECRYGTYRRDVLLPEGVDPEGIRAEYVDGILSVTMPIPAEKVIEPKAIKVKVGTPMKIGATSS